MKSLSLSVLLLASMGAVACQSVGTDESAAAQPRTLNTTNLQSQTIVTLPPNDGRTAAEQPYALQGTAPSAPAAPMGMGYQAR